LGVGEERGSARRVPCVGEREGGVQLSVKERGEGRGAWLGQRRKWAGRRGLGGAAVQAVCALGRGERSGPGGSGPSEGREGVLGCGLVSREWLSPSFYFYFFQNLFPIELLSKINKIKTTQNSLCSSMNAQSRLLNL